MSRGRRPLERSEFEAALQRVLDLPTKDQLELFASLRQYLGDDLTSGEEAKDRQIEERTGALRAIEAVAKQLKLPKDKAPTSTQFKQAAPKAAPDWNVTRVTRAFGRWRLAQRAFLGEDLLATAAQLDQRRQTIARKRSHEDLIAGVRQWLRSKPSTESQPSYDQWRKQENKRREKSGEPPLVLAVSTRVTLSLPWEAILEIAKGKTTLAAERKARAKVLGQGRFAGKQYVAYLLGCAERDIDAYLRRGEFPTPVAQIGKFQVWETADLKAYAAGRSYPKRQPMELQERIMSTQQLATELGVQARTLMTWVDQKRWDKVPEPAERMGQHRIWWRDDVKKWRKERKSR